jgi:dTDP-4-dehydrorhamnose reductase
MKVLITGAGGGLGRALVGALAGTEHEVHAYRHAELDIADGARVREIAEAVVPEIIVNAAAMTNVDACEDETTYEQVAVPANVLGPKYLAIAARWLEATLVHVSTDYVFDGTKGAPYDERDEPNPLGRYARSKLEGEERVREETDRHLIVRTAFVFGGGDDHLTRSLRRLAEGEPAGGLVDRIGSPSYVRHLAERLVPLALTERFGTYHLAGLEPTTWHDVLERAKRLAPDVLTGDVLEQRTDELDLPAPRPRDSSLTSVLLPELADAVPPMPSLDDALEHHLASLFDGD